jgi:hypothetical protein
MKDKEEKLTPSLILKMFAETDKKFAELAEDRKATDKQIAELAEDRKATDKQIKELSKNINGIANSNGEMAEEMIFNSLKKDKTFAGIKFYDIDRNIKLKSKALKLDSEFDVVLENGDTVAIIETKYKVREKDVSELLNKKLNNFRKLFPMYANYKIMLGVGGMSFEKKAIAEANKKGIGIIKIVGDKVEYQTENVKIY